MARDQTAHELGLASVAIFDAILAAPITGRQVKVALALLRMTYGFGKATDQVASSQLAGMTRIHDADVRRELRALQKLGLVGSSGSAPGGRTIPQRWLEADVSTWEVWGERGAPAPLNEGGPGALQGGAGARVGGTGAPHRGAQAPSRGAPAPRQIGVRGAPAPHSYVGNVRRRDVPERRDFEGPESGPPIPSSAADDRVEQLRGILHDRSPNASNLHSLVRRWDFGDLHTLAHDAWSRYRDGLVTNAVSWFVAEATRRGLCGEIRMLKVESQAVEREARS